MSTKQPLFCPPTGRVFRGGYSQQETSANCVLCTAGDLVLVDTFLLRLGEGRVHFDATHLLTQNLQPCPVAIWVAGHSCSTYLMNEIVPFRPLPINFSGHLTRDQLRPVVIAESEDRSATLPSNRLAVAPLTTYKVSSKAVLGVMNWRAWESAEECWTRRWLRASRAPSGRAPLQAAVDHVAPCVVQRGGRDWVVIDFAGRGLSVALSADMPDPPLPSRYQLRVPDAITAADDVASDASGRMRYAACDIASRQLYQLRTTLAEWASAVRALVAAGARTLRPRRVPLACAPPPPPQTAPLRGGNGPTHHIIVNVPAPVLPAGCNSAAPSVLVRQAALSQGIVQGQQNALAAYRLGALDAQHHELARSKPDVVPASPVSATSSSLALELESFILNASALLPAMAAEFVRQDITSVAGITDYMSAEVSSARSPRVVATEIVDTICPLSSWATLGQKAARSRLHTFLSSLVPEIVE